MLCFILLFGLGVFSMIKAIQRVQHQYQLKRLQQMSVRLDAVVQAPPAAKSAITLGGMSVPDPAASSLSDALSWRPLDASAALPIPRVVHQTWPSRELPAKLASFVRSWHRLQPHWGYRLHTDSDNQELVKSRYEWLWPHYAAMTSIQQADVARLLYMHAFGGVYADLDVELLQPLHLCSS